MHASSHARKRAPRRRSRRAHRITLRTQSFIGFLHSLSRDAIFDPLSLPSLLYLSLSSCNIYLAFSLSTSILSSGGVAFCLYVSAFTFIGSLQNCTRVCSLFYRLHHRSSQQYKLSQNDPQGMVKNEATELGHQISHFLWGILATDTLHTLLERLSLRRQHVAWRRRSGVTSQSGPLSD